MIEFHLILQAVKSDTSARLFVRGKVGAPTGETLGRLDLRAQSVPVGSHGRNPTAEPDRSSSLAHRPSQATPLARHRLLWRRWGLTGP